MAIAVTAFKIAYMALPKAACSTVKRALAEIDPDVTLPPPDARARDIWHTIYPTRRFREDVWKNFDGFWRFCIVRDPARRLMSCYTNRVVDRKVLHHSANLRRGRVDLPMDPDPDFFFQNLAAYRQASSDVKHHSLGAGLFLGSPPQGYDNVYRTEELDRFARDLSERCGREVTLAKENHSSSSLSIFDLAPRTRETLFEFLAQEYQTLGAYYENPLA